MVLEFFGFLLFFLVSFASAIDGGGASSEARLCLSLLSRDIVI